MKRREDQKVSKRTLNIPTKLTPITKSNHVLNPTPNIIQKKQIWLRRNSLLLKGLNSFFKIVAE